ncbi:hypothetical protein RN001_015991 [Aquatica leii]|uniref:DDE Tnp4 domain-containing protein n=1 Tax=Aquatica leii TaxID=1421715 RepID=A0AAN7PNP0_9COLE|nr:hypothetical protein RN001_015991 [Aquatica leii]
MIVTVEKKVGMSLYYLASCCEYRVVANQFGVHKSTVCRALHQFVRATNNILTPKHIRMPNEAEATDIARAFEHASHIPNIIGAIDGTHIPMLPPTVGYRGYEWWFIIIGDPAYPLLSWLVKGYTGTGLTPNEDSFNAHMNTARVTVEIAFGRLKARWRCLLKRLDIDHSFVPHAIATCCTLHNI